MAKKKRSSRGGENREDDATSIASSSTLMSLKDLNSRANSDEEDEFVDPFEQALETLYEKRSATRIAGLATLVGLLERSYCYEDCIMRKDSIVSQMLSCIRKGGTAEASLAARALGLHLLTLGIGTDLDSLYEDAILTLQKLALATGKDAMLRSLALELVALLTFVALEDPDRITKTINGLLTVAGDAGNARVAASALRGWSLLVSSLPHWRLNGAFYSSSLGALSPHLHVNDVAQRDAAGEATALLFSTSDMPAGDNSSDEEDANGIGEIVDRMKMLATNRGDENRRSKKDRSFLKSSFREHTKIIQGHNVKFDKIKLPDGRTLVIDSLSGQIELDAFRSFLGPAFQCQLENNSVLHDIFGLEPSLDLDNLGYRVNRIPSAEKQKMRSKNRSKDQLNKAYLNGSMLDE